MENNEAFLGRGWSFPPEFFFNGAGVALVAGEEDIRQSLYILFATSLRERTMFPSYGSELSRYLFEEIDQSLINGLRGVVSDAILHHEPRIKVDSVEIDTSIQETGLLLIAVAYTIRTTNNRYNLVYPFYIKEGSGQQPNPT
jgi:phage baseplate assembly protein W